MKLLLFSFSLLVTGVLTRPQFGREEEDNGDFESVGNEDFGSGDNPSSYQSDGEYVPARYGGAADTPSIRSYQSNEYLPSRRRENSEGCGGDRDALPSTLRPRGDAQKVTRWEPLGHWGRLVAPMEPGNHPSFLAEAGGGPLSCYLRI
ncbi:hypothetical protein Fcan01_23726 [Folsomia candida]|uniref:Uncharacterized protein n=1 Tax=Folsomia candida TaxID=158441 RepID=A0A226D857_FOLCA|nr:hypothetical protein Fcan01_23726 [Folsomia candida]